MSEHRPRAWPLPKAIGVTQDEVLYEKAAFIRQKGTSPSAFVMVSQMCHAHKGGRGKAILMTVSTLIDGCCCWFFPFSLALLRKDVMHERLPFCTLSTPLGDVSYVYLNYEDEVRCYGGNVSRTDASSGTEHRRRLGSSTALFL